MLAAQQFHKRYDAALLGLGVLAITASSVLLLWDISFIRALHAPGAMSQLRAPIASLQTEESEVRRRQSIGTHWENVGNASGLYDRDLVFTDRKSAALINFEHGAKLQLGPLSMVVIDKKTDAPAVDVKRGVFSATMDEAGQQFIIRHQGNETKLIATAKSQIAIELEDSGDARIAVAEGAVTLQQGTEQFAIAEQEQRIIAGKAGSISAVVKNPMRIQRPKSAAEFQVGESTTFEWELDVDQVSTLRLEMSASPQFIEPIKKIEVPLEERHMDVPNPTVGKVYWRFVIEYGDGRRFVTPKVFYAVRPIPVIAPLAPKPESHQFMRNSRAVVSFSWAQNFSGDTALEIARDVSFATIERSLSVKQSPNLQTITSPGTYYWRLVSGKISSPVRNFTIDPEPKAAAEPVVMPPAAIAPEVTPASTPLPIPEPVQENPAPVEEKVPEPEDSLPAPEIKQQIEIKLRDGSHSVPRKNFWTLMESALLGTSVAYAEEQNQEIEWAQVPGAAAYAIQISKDNAFERMIVDTVTAEHSFDPKDLDPDTYWYRVAARTPSGKVGLFSTPGKLVIKAGRITALLPAHKAEVEENTEGVLFSWKRPKVNVRVKLEVATTDEFAQLAEQYECACDDIRLKIKSAGIYYWRIVGTYANGTKALPTKTQRFQFKPKEIAATVAAAQKMAPVKPDPTPQSQQVPSAKPAATQVASLATSRPGAQFALAAHLLPLKINDRKVEESRIAPVDATLFNSFGGEVDARCGPRCRVEIFFNRAVSYAADDTVGRVEFLRYAATWQWWFVQSSGWALGATGGLQGRDEPVYLQQAGGNQEVERFATTDLLAGLKWQKSVAQASEINLTVTPGLALTKDAKQNLKQLVQAGLEWNYGWHERGRNVGLSVTYEAAQYDSSYPNAGVGQKWSRSQLGLRLATGYSL